MHAEVISEVMQLRILFHFKKIRLYRCKEEASTPHTVCLSLPLTPLPSHALSFTYSAFLQCYLCQALLIQTAFRKSREGKISSWYLLMKLLVRSLIILFSFRDLNLLLFNVFKHLGDLLPNTQS